MIQVIRQFGGSVTLHRGESFDLTCIKTIEIPGLTYGRISHEIWVTVDGLVLLYRKPGMFEDRNLIIDSGPVVSGEVFTHVFNLSKRGVRVLEGESISALLCL